MPVLSTERVPLTLGRLGRAPGGAELMPTSEGCPGADVEYPAPSPEGCKAPLPPSIGDPETGGSYLGVKGMLKPLPHPERKTEIFPVHRYYQNWAE